MGALPPAPRSEPSRPGLGAAAASPTSAKSAALMAEVLMLGRMECDA